MQKKKILILSMSCTRKDFMEEEQAIKETWAKDILDGKYQNISWYAYRNTLYEHPYDMNNIIYVPELDDRKHTYQKTIACFKYVKDKFDFDYIVRTNTSQYVNVKLLDKFIEELDYEDENIYTGQICFNTSSNLKVYGRGNFIIFSKKVFERIVNASNLCPYGGNKDLYIDDFVIANQLEKDYFEKEQDKQSIDYLKQVPYLWYENKPIVPYSYDGYKDKLGICVKHYGRSQISNRMKSIHQHIMNETKEFVIPNEFNSGKVIYFNDEKLTSKSMTYSEMKQFLINKGIYKGNYSNEEINDKEKVSIVIPLYNAEKYIEETIDSVISQIYQNWECIIVNDGSTDNSENVVLEKIKNNPKFKYYKQENSGPGRARNYGASLANGKYLLFLDADDIILDNYLFDGVEFMESHLDYTLFYGKAKVFWENGVEKEWKLRIFSDMKDFLRSNCIYCTALIKKKEFDKVGGFDEKLFAFEDWEFFVRLLNNNPKVFRTDNFVFKYRKHTGSRDDLNKNRWLEIKKIVEEKNKDIFDKWNGKKENSPSPKLSGGFSTDFERIRTKVFSDTRKNNIRRKLRYSNE